MAVEQKGKIISEIIRLTGVDQTKYFDRLSDKSLPYLKKLLKVINAL